MLLYCDSPCGSIAQELFLVGIVTSLVTVPMVWLVNGSLETLPALCVALFVFYWANVIYSLMMIMYSTSKGGYIADIREH